MNPLKDTPDGVITHQRADGILLGRSTDSRRGDMDALRKYVEFLRGEITHLRPVPVAHVPADSCQTCCHAPGCPNVSAGGLCMYHRDKDGSL